VRFIRQTISSFIKLSLLLLVLGWGSSAYSADLISPADNDCSSNLGDGFFLLSSTRKQIKNKS